MPDFTREFLQTKVLYQNFDMLYLHMDSHSVLPKLQHNDIIDTDKAEQIDLFTQRCAKNIKLIHALYNISLTSEVVLKLCDALETTVGQETLAKRLLAG